MRNIASTQSSTLIMDLKWSSGFMRISGIPCSAGEGELPQSERARLGPRTQMRDTGVFVCSTV